MVSKINCNHEELIPMFCKEKTCQKQACGVFYIEGDDDPKAFCYDHLPTDDGIEEAVECSRCEQLIHPDQANDVGEYHTGFMCDECRWD